MCTITRFTRFIHKIIIIITRVNIITSIKKHAQRQKGQASPRANKGNGVPFACQASTTVIVARHDTCTTHLFFRLCVGEWCVFDE